MIPVLSILEIGAKLLDKVIPDKDAREKAQAELIKAAQDQDFQLALAQIKVNEEEALSTFSMENQEEHIQKIMDMISNN